MELIIKDMPFTGNNKQVFTNRGDAIAVWVCDKCGTLLTDNYNTAYRLEGFGTFCKRCIKHSRVELTYHDGPCYSYKTKKANKELDKSDSQLPF